MSIRIQNNVGLLRRLGAILYDLLLLFAVLLITSLPWVISGIREGQEGYALYIVFIYILIPSYYIGFWIYGGQTLGMKTWNIRVVDLNGQPLGWGKSVLRLVYALLSTMIFGLGFVYALVDRHNRTWHDILSKSRLIIVLSATDKAPAAKKE